VVTIAPTINNQEGRATRCADCPYLIADRLNDMTKYVASRTLDEVTWKGTTLLRGEAAESVAALKREDGPDLQVQGSSVLLQTLLAHDLVDEFTVWTFPVLLGRGKRLFGPGGHPGALRLVGTETSGTGVVISTYERAGDVPIGSFQLEEPTEAEIKRRASLAG
jgi:dihydrofolate reductase